MLPLLFVALFGLAAGPAARAQTYAWQALAGAPQNGQKQDDVFFLDAQQGWAVNGSGQIHRTRDGGLIWQGSTLGRYINKVRLLRGPAGQLTGYAIGLNVTKLSATLVTAAASAAPAVAFALTAFPNPATRQVTLRYELPRRQPVRLVLRDLLGREIATVFDFTQDAGPHELTYSFPPTLASNLVQFTLRTAEGRATLPISVQP